MTGKQSIRKNLVTFAIFIFLLIFFTFSLSAEKLTCGWAADGYSQKYDSNGVFAGPAFSLYQTFFNDISIEELDPEYSFAYTEIGFVDYILLADFNQSSQKIKDSELFFSSPLINLSYNFLVKKDQHVLWNGWTFLSEGRLGILNTDNVDIIQNYLNGLMKRENINFEIVIYSSLAEMQADLFSGKINTMLVNSLYSSKNLKVMSKTPVFASLVLASADENKISQLNNIIIDLNETTPDYFNNLFDSYLKPSNFGGIVFTRDEAAFMYAHPSLIAAISFQQDALISLNYGVYSGSVYNIFERISDLTSIKWKYEPQMYVSLSDQSFDVHMCCYEDTDFAIANGLNLTQGYMSIPFEIVSSNNIIRRIALEKDSGYNNIIIRNYPECEFEYLATSKSCIDAVKNRNVDAFIAPFYIVQDGLTQKDIETGLIVKYVDDFSIKMGCGVSKNVDPILVDILNKALNFIDLKKYERQVLEKIENNYNPDFSKGIIIRENYTTVSWMIFLAILVILLFIIFIFYFGYRKRVENFLYFDEVLDCYNQKGFERRVEELQKTPSTKFQYLVNFTISHLNESGTATGINKGDQVVRNIAMLLDKECSNEECYGRVQSDNFIILLAAREDTDFNLRVKELERKIRFLQKNSLLILNIGVYKAEDRSFDVSQMIEYSAIARVSRRENPSQNIIFYDEKYHQMRIQDNELISYMPTALKNGEFKVYFHPKFEVGTHDIIGAEALSRWFHPKYGIISPFRFIRLFEENGILAKLDFYMLNQVCAYLRNLIDNGYSIIPISVNFSRGNLVDENLPQKIIQIVDSFHISHNLIEIEVVESTVATVDEDVLISALNFLKKEGFIISIDDFGSGLSSLSTLSKIPAHVIKLDKSFLENNSNSEFGRRILESIFYIINKQGLISLTEGVETYDEFNYIKACGCYAVQGFLFSKPINGEDFMKMLHTTPAHLPNPHGLGDVFSTLGDNEVSVVQERIILQSVLDSSAFCSLVNISQSSLYILKNELLFNNELKDTVDFDFFLSSVKKSISSELVDQFDKKFSPEALRKAVLNHETEIVLRIKASSKEEEKMKIFKYWKISVYLSSIRFESETLGFLTIQKETIDEN